jgi:hypothetical protein
MSVWLSPPPDVVDDDAVPYFNWDAPVPNAVIRRALAQGPDADRLYWMGRILREARYDDVWAYVTLAQLREHFDAVLPYLGRRRPFWEFLFAAWRDRGVV